jgi:hypothetical protein
MIHRRMTVPAALQQVEDCIEVIDAEVSGATDIPIAHRLRLRRVAEDLRRCHGVLLRSHAVRRPWSPRRGR